ncbi:response regulator [Tolypothrix bouteillei VB521301_2]|nr:response regulator [Tolypothrix bouteillei]
MIVDDEQDVKLLFQQKFRRESRQNQITFYFAFSGEEALEQLQNNRTKCLSLVLADINMPGMNGLELLKIIKERFPDLKVFIITAYDDDKNYRAAKKLGADDYITKPIEFNKLKEKILSL